MPTFTEDDLREYILARSVTENHAEAAKLIRENNKLNLNRARGIVLDTWQAAKPVIEREATKLLREYAKQYKPTHLIFRNPDTGTYYYNGHLIVIPDDTLYYHVFDIVMRYAHPFEGISYKEIEQYLFKRKHKIEDSYKKANDLSKQIRQAIVHSNQGFFSYARVAGKHIKNQLPDDPGKKIFKAKKLRIFVNNPLIA